MLGTSNHVDLLRSFAYAWKTRDWTQAEAAVAARIKSQTNVSRWLKQVYVHLLEGAPAIPVPSHKNRRALSAWLEKEGVPVPPTQEMLDALRYRALQELPIQKASGTFNRRNTR